MTKTPATRRAFLAGLGAIALSACTPSTDTIIDVLAQVAAVTPAIPSAGRRYQINATAWIQANCNPTCGGTV